MGQGDAGVGGRRETGGHPGDHLKANPLPVQVHGLFAAPAEHIRIAPFEAGDHLAFGGLFGQQAIDLVLGGVMAAAGFADVDALGRGGGRIEKLGVGQVVVNHHVRPAQAVHPLDGDQAGIARAGPDQVYDSLLQ